jgi:hypothetical protein
MGWRIKDTIEVHSIGVNDRKLKRLANGCHLKWWIILWTHVFVFQKKRTIVMFTSWRLEWLAPAGGEARSFWGKDYWLYIVYSLLLNVHCQQINDCTHCRVNNLSQKEHRVVPGLDNSWHSLKTNDHFAKAKANAKIIKKYRGALNF